MGSIASLTAADATIVLGDYASPEKAKSSSWFFKSGVGEYGAGDRFLGVTVPEQRRVAKQFTALPLVEVGQLLQSPIHEHRLTALFILVGQYQKGSEEVQKSVVDCYLKNLDQVNNWDLVDSSAPQILGDWMRTHSKRALPSWAKSKNVWHRRIAMLTCQAFIRAGEFGDALKIAKILVHDSHDLIQKAVGWMLREIGDRDQAAERNFLDRHAVTMPRTMLRYAIEKFPPDLRTHYLKMGTTRKV